MKLKNTLFIIAVMLLAACAHQPKSFKVVGTTTGLPDSSRVIISTTGTYRENLDSTILMDGKFEMELPYDSVAEHTQLYIICLKKDTPHDRWTSAEFYAEPGATIQIHLDLEEANNNTVGGSPLNEIQNKYMKELDAVGDAFFEARRLAGDETPLPVSGPRLKPLQTL